MQPAIALVDYGAGNLASVRKALIAAGASLFVPRAPAELACAAGIVIPGVGHFAATASLDAEWRQAITDAVGRARPLLGICLGMQWLFEGSEEAPGVPGLGTIPGICRRLPPGQKVPHVGWNALELRRTSRLLENLGPNTYAYFAHAYAAPITEACAAVTSYGTVFAAAIEHGLLFGVQFHPEKSGPAGLQVLANFVRAACRNGGPPLESDG